ncbi:MAG: protein phosphatase CheZ [Methylococcales bacterium]|nr:protein phosphatase CheZ [Rhodospirillales bacterium]
MTSDSCLALAKDLVLALENGDDVVADGILDEIAGLRETQLFQEVGRLTRQLHDTMLSFSLDSSISTMTKHDIPDAKERLQYVITMTEQAADKTLTTIENLLPVSQEINDQVGQLSGKWERFLDREMPFEEFKSMSMEITCYFQTSKESLEQIQNGLSEILLTQGFQDVTGQIIKRVINLVHNLENSLVELIRISGETVNPSASHVGQDLELPGPVVPGVDDQQGDVVQSQSDVDDLLSSLGF